MATRSNRKGLELKALLETSQQELTRLKIQLEVRVERTIASGVKYGYNNMEWEGILCEIEDLLQ